MQLPISFGAEFTMEQKRQAIFDTLKPTCLSLLGECKPMTRENSRSAASTLKLLLAQLNTIPDAETIFDTALIEMIVFPLLNLFRSMNNDAPIFDNVAEAWLQCILFLLRNTPWKRTCAPVMQRQLVTLFTLTIEPPARQVKQPSEEIKRLGVQCLEAMMPAEFMTRRHQQGPNTLQDEASRPVLAQCITVLLNIARDERNMTLRLEAIRTLSALLLDNLQNPQFLEGFFPGVASTICRVIWQKKEKEHHQIIIACLDFLGDLIEAVMGDAQNVSSFQKPSTFQDLRHIGIVKQHSQEPSTERSVAPHTTHKVRLYSLLKEIMSVQSHPEWRARFSFIDFSSKMLTHCSQSLDNCVSLFVEVIVLHADDEHPDVAVACRQRMYELLAITSFQDTIIPVLKDGLYAWIQELPRCLISGDEQEKMNVMALIIGYILLLRDRSQSVLDAALGRAADGWLSALEIDMDNINVLEEKHEKRIELNANISHYPKVHFKHLMTDRTTHQVSRMLNVIGRFGNLQHWVTHFMRCIHVDEGIADKAQPQAAYVIHELLAGATAMDEDVEVEWVIDEGRNETRLKNIALQALHDVMDILNNPLMQSKAKDTVDLRVQVSAVLESAQVLTTCFGLQIVGLAAVILQRKLIHDELITILYPILSHLGSPNIFIHAYALITLDAIALVCGEQNAQDLAIKNVDYIINAVSQRISMLTSHPRVPMVLKALIHVGGPGTINYLEDSVEEIYDALDRYHSNPWLCQQLCAVFTEIVQTIEASSTTELEGRIEGALPRISGGQEPATVSKEIVELVQEWHAEDANTESRETSTMEAIGRYFLEEQAKNKETPRLEELIEGDTVRGKTVESKETNEEDAERKSPLSKHQQMVLGIMNKVAHFLSAPSAQLRSQMLLLLAAGANVLASRTDELFPLVHHLWTSIVQRLEDPEHFVAFHAAYLVQTLSHRCGDFLSTRVVNDVWLRFKRLLRQREQHVSYSAFSYEHRLDRCILQTLASVADRVALRPSVVLEMLDLTQPFLDISMHEELQRHAVGLFEALGRQHPDMVWLCCLALLQHPRRTPPSGTLLSPFDIPDVMRPLVAMNCGTNAERIMMSCCT